MFLCFFFLILLSGKNNKVIFHICSYAKMAFMKFGEHSRCLQSIPKKSNLRIFLFPEMSEISDVEKQTF